MTQSQCLLVLLCLLLLQLTFGEWTRLLGGSGSDLGYEIAVDSDGNVFVTGQTTSSVLDGQTNSGSYDIVISKWHSNGTRLWTRLLGGSSNDYGYGIATDSMGNVFVTGWSNSSVLDDQTGAGSIDIVISKWHSNGTQIWTRLLGGPGDDIAWGMAADLEGNVFVTGWSSSSVLDNQTNSGGIDIVISKWHSNGTRLWTRLLGGTGVDRGRGIATDQSGNVFVTGSTTSAVLDGQTLSGQFV